MDEFFGLVETMQLLYISSPMAIKDAWYTGYYVGLGGSNCHLALIHGHLRFVSPNFQIGHVLMDSKLISFMYLTVSSFFRLGVMKLVKN